jgi:hypothetical protein
MSQTIHDEAAYISESFGLPYTTALEITLANARRAARATNVSKSAITNKKKKGNKRVDRR